VRGCMHQPIGGIERLMNYDDQYFYVAGDE
jgi:hypothetical protein